MSRPIAGTRRRGRTDEHDRMMAAELIEHPKERAEHVMLVDLARNDVGRVAEFGSVHVDELMTLERYSHVMHMTSQVSGPLRGGLGPIDVLRATLPVASRSPFAVLQGATAPRKAGPLDDAHDDFVVIDATSRRVVATIVDGLLEYEAETR